MLCAHRSRNSLWLAWGFPYVITQVNGIPYSQFLSLIQRHVLWSIMLHLIKLLQLIVIGFFHLQLKGTLHHLSLPASSLRRRINGPPVPLTSRRSAELLPVGNSDWLCGTRAYRYVYVQQWFTCRNTYVCKFPTTGF